MAKDKLKVQGRLEDFGEEEQDALFKAQMAIANAFLGYWKHGLGVCLVILTFTFGFGSWENNVRNTQREIQSELAKIDLKMPDPNPMFLAGLGAMDDPEDAQRIAELAEGARRYEQVAKNGQGPGAVMAYLRAAEAWERAGEAERTGAARIAAGDIAGEGVIGWAAVAGKANALAAGGDVNGAAAVLRTMADSDTSYVNQQALFDLGQLYAGVGRSEESRAAFQELATKYPQSKLAPRATQAIAQAGEAG